MIKDEGAKYILNDSSDQFQLKLDMVGPRNKVTVVILFITSIYMYIFKSITIFDRILIITIAIYRPKKMFYTIPIHASLKIPITIPITVNHN